MLNPPPSNTFSKPRFVRLGPSGERRDRTLHRLIWLYFWLLIFEGALRKWLLPELSTPLLLVRDPVVLLIYFQAMRTHRFPVNGAMFTYLAIMTAFGLLALVQTLGGIGGGALVAAYGLRTNFLHLPLIFLLPIVFSYEDVVKFGRWILLISLPMAPLMVMQFLSSPSSWINASTIEGGEQIGSALGRIRPAGTFSFISGPVHFFALATAFVIFGLMEKKIVYPRWLVWAALFSVLAVQPISGSRALVLCCAIPLLAAVAFGLLNPGRAHAFLYTALLIAAVAVILPQFSFFREGMLVFSTRWDQANASSGGAQRGLIGRSLNAFIEPFARLSEAGLIGNGIGLGTSVGSKLASGSVQFLLAETEWARVVLEAGPVLGFAFIGYRVWLAGMVGLRTFVAAKRQQLLPWLLAGGACLGLVNEQLGQSSNLGFMVLASGLCLASIRRNPSRAAERLRYPNRRAT
jgi:hypothetical protein